MEDIRITVLTDPIPVGIERVLIPLRTVARCVKHFFFPPPFFLGGKPLYRGHSAVTRSLVEGLLKIGINVNYNPRFIKDVADNVVVPGGVPALKQAMRFKKKGHIKKLLTGPNTVAFPHDYNHLVADPEVDVYFAPCELVARFCIDDSPRLQGRCIVWPAGVDVGYWKPKNQNLQKILFYIKECTFHDPEVFKNLNVSQHISYVVELGYEVVIIRYGEYTPQSLREALDDALLMVVFTYQESQGLAWAQAWSMNVPTLIFYNDQFTWDGKVIKSSTAPYLTDDTGLFFKDFDDFKINFDRSISGKHLFSPRQWVLDNMSDEKSAEHILRIIERC